MITNFICVTVSLLLIICTVLVALAGRDPEGDQAIEYLKQLGNPPSPYGVLPTDQCPDPLPPRHGTARCVPRRVRVHVTDAEIDGRME